MKGGEIIRLSDVTYNEFQYIQKQLLSIQPYIKNYGDKFYKMIVLKHTFEYAGRKFTAKGDGNNDTKLECNLIRSKSRVFELGMCNDWDWFITATLSPKYDRTDLKNFIKELSHFIRNQSRLKNVDYKYLLVPELHLDGVSWHMHGFLKGICERDMPQFKEGDPVPPKLIEKGYYNWLPYSERFGWVSLGKIQNAIKASFYMRKYITKTLMKCNLELGAHTYYASHGLLGAKESIPLAYNSVNDPMAWNLKFSSDFCDVIGLTNEEGVKMLEKYKINENGSMSANIEPKMK